MALPRSVPRRTDAAMDADVICRGVSPTGIVQVTVDSYSRNRRAGIQRSIRVVIWIRLKLENVIRFNGKKLEWRDITRYKWVFSSLLRQR